MFGQSDDLIGLAVSWEAPTDPALGDQYVVEAFYRFHLTPDTHLTPDIQIVVDPANAPDKEAVAIFGLLLVTYIPGLVTWLPHAVGY